MATRTDQATGCCLLVLPPAANRQPSVTRALVCIRPILTELQLRNKVVDKGKGMCPLGQSEALKKVVRKGKQS